MQVPLDRIDAEADRMPAALDARRPRSAGPLLAVEISLCRRNGIALAFDPLQGGWVTAACTDDLAPIAEERVARRGAAPTVLLRPWAAGDAPRLAALLGDARVWTYLPDPWPGALTAETAADLIALSNEGAHHHVLAIEAGGEAVGQVRLLFEQGGRAGEISYWLGADHWGRGIASTAVAAFTARCLAEHRDLATIHARVHADNAASARVLERAGYTRRPGRDAPPWLVWARDRA